jgi:hypothetical protein
LLPKLLLCLLSRQPLLVGLGAETIRFVSRLIGTLRFGRCLSASRVGLGTSRVGFGLGLFCRSTLRSFTLGLFLRLLSLLLRELRLPGRLRCFLLLGGLPGGRFLALVL